MMVLSEHKDLRLTMTEQYEKKSLHALLPNKN